MRDVSHRKKIIFAGVCRNCAKFINHIFSQIAMAGELFEDFHYVVVESDSKDGTVKKLAKWHSKLGKGNLILLGHLEGRYPKRTERIAFARNQYISYIQKNEALRQFDYICILDFDRVNLLFSLSRLVQVFNKIEFEWDAIFANQLFRYYDIWALRHDVWCPEDCLWQVREKPSFLSHRDAYSHFVKSRQINISLRHEPIEVKSAFGGLGLYKRELFKNVRYVGINHQGEEVCEHVTLHEMMNERGEKFFFIHPQIINSFGPRRTILERIHFWPLKLYQLSTKLFIHTARLPPDLKRRPDVQDISRRKHRSI